MKAQRDVFLEELLSYAKKDRDIVLITVDMGAPALDLWRSELPQQFFTAGISEQNAINLAAGMSASGKKAYVYFMACWAARCLEQIRYSCAMANNPITILGNGVGLGYAPAGPAHEPTDDLTYMSAIDEMRICSPSSNAQVIDLVRETLENSMLRYVRFERSISTDLEHVSGLAWNARVDNHWTTLVKAKSHKIPTLTILSSGYLLERALVVAKKLEASKEVSVGVVDLHTLPIVDLNNKLRNHLLESKFIATLEEQGPSAGFANQVHKFMSKNSIVRPMREITLKKSYIFENGTREELLNSNNLSITDIVRTLEIFLEN